jgi:hypothetical protein
LLLLLLLHKETEGVVVELHGREIEAVVVGYNSDIAVGGHVVAAHEKRQTTTNGPSHVWLSG